MDYGERFNYGRIKDDFDCPNPNGYYSSTHTSSDLDSTFNPISSLDDLQEEYPDKFIIYQYPEKISENEKEISGIKRKAKAFDKIYKLLYSKFTCETNYKDIYGGKNGPIKVGQWLEGCILKQPKLTDKETIKLLNLLLMGMGSEYYVQLNGYIGLDDKDDGKRSL